MKYKVSVIKKIAFLVMTMALAGAMVACKGAVGPAAADDHAADDHAADDHARECGTGGIRRDTGR